MCVSHVVLVGLSLRLNDGSGITTFVSSWLGIDDIDDLSLVGPTGVQLFDLCCSTVSVLGLLLSTHLVSSQHWILIYMFAALMH